MNLRSRLALHVDPEVRERLPAFGRFARWYILGCAAAAALIVGGAIVGGDRGIVAGALAPVVPAALQVYLGVRLWNFGQGWLQRYWRSMTVGVAVSGLAFLTVALRGVLSREVLLVLQGLLVPSATFFLLFALWVRLQATRGVTSTVGFFDFALVVSTALAYLMYLFTAPYIARSGAEGGLGGWVLTACVLMLVIVMVLVGRRARVPGLTADEILAVSLFVAVAAMVVTIALSFGSGKGALEAAPGWVFGAGWTLAFAIGALCPFAEVSSRAATAAPGQPAGRRPYWPYAILCLTPPLTLYSVFYGSGEAKVGTLVATLLVVEVLVVRQLVLIGEQRSAYIRSRALKDTAAAEAVRTNVLLDLALSLSAHETPGVMCDTAAAAVERLVAAESIVVLVCPQADAQPEDMTSGVRGDSGVDPAAAWRTLEQLGLAVSRPVAVGAAWAGFPPGSDVVVAAVIGAGGTRSGYVAVRPEWGWTGDTSVLEGVADQLALALDRSVLIHEVRRNADRVREVVDRLEEGVADLDLERRVRACNRAFATFIGSEVDDVIGKVFPPHLMAAVDVDSLVTRLHRGMVVSEVEMTSPSGDPKVYEFSLMRRPARGSDPEGVLVVVRDVGEERQERRSLLRLLDDLVLAAAGPVAAASGADPAPRHDVATRLLAEVVPELELVRDTVAGLPSGEDPGALASLNRRLSLAGSAMRDMIETVSWEGGG